eukprot:PhF_6_TR39839/c0_g1_i1/m.59240
MITRPSSAYATHPYSAQHTPERGGPLCASPVEERLSVVKSNLANLSASLREDVDAKREYEENRLHEVRELATKIERHLALEVKRRTESDKALQAMLEMRVKEVSDFMERKMADKLNLMQQNVDILTKKLEKVTSELASEREKTGRLTQELRSQYLQGLQEMKQGVEVEKIQRMEKEALLLKRLTEDVHRLQERLDVERHTREQAIKHIKETDPRMGRTGDKSDERFRAHLLDDIECLKTALRLESDARERSEETLASTMDEVVRQVHAGLRLIPS